LIPRAQHGQHANPYSYLPFPATVLSVFCSLGKQERQEFLHRLTGLCIVADAGNVVVELDAFFVTMVMTPRSSRVTSMMPSSVTQ
jgi:hypothetical protein